MSAERENKLSREAHKEEREYRIAEMVARARRTRELTSPTHPTRVPQQKVPSDVGAQDDQPE